MRKSKPTAYIVLIIILLSVVFLLLLGVLTNKRISAYTLTYLSAKPYEMLDLIVNYFFNGANNFTRSSCIPSVTENK